jgi:CelD/BcsL family acetyltransferase involved in cellulose biosynthesis
MIRTRSELGPHVAAWDRLALVAGSPFMTHAWLSCWWSAFGAGEPIWLVALDADDSLRAGALLYRRAGRLAAAANVHSGDWDALARDEDSRAALWAAALDIGVNRIHLQGMPASPQGTRALRETLERRGYRVLSVAGPHSPWLALPGGWEDLLATLGSSLRRQVGRRRRMLEREGSVVFRTVAGGPTLDRDLGMFLALEAAGWKGRAGTAILSNASTERLYRDFARLAAARGWLRLHLLELEGTLIAASYDCAFAGRAYLLKTTYSETHARLSPGLVLLADVLRSSIGEGLCSYDFLGGPDAYKTRWTSELHPRQQIFAYRGIARPGLVYRKRLRPLLKAARGRIIAGSPRRAA